MSQCACARSFLLKV